MKSVLSLAWRRTELAGVLTLIACGLGCSTAPTAPRPVAMQIHVSLTVSSQSGSPASPIVARIEVRNDSPVPVAYFTACYGARPTINFWEPDRHNVNEVCEHCPNALCLACAGTYAALQPGETVTGEDTFDGHLYTCDGVYTAGDKDYTIEGLFEAYPYGDPTSSFAITRSVVVHWTP